MNYWSYLLYQTPEKASFDEYWRTVEKWRNSKEYKNSFSPMPVEDYRKMISLDIDIVTKAIREEKNHEPTISELKDGLVNWWMKIHRGEDLMITQRDFTFKEADEIIKQVSCIFR